MTSQEFQERLANQARQVDLSISTILAAQLELYFRLLAKWNHRINLSGLNLESPEPTALDRLLIEPLLAAKHVNAPYASMVDIGSGGGSPAIPMALALAPIELVMVESRSRKSVFLQEATRQLGMRGAQVATARYETLASEPDFQAHFDLLTVRAVRVSPGSLNELQAFVKPGGLLMLFRSEVTNTNASTELPFLRLLGSHRLVPSLRSRIDILEKRSM